MSKVILSEIQRQILLDLDRVLMALDRTRVPAAIAKFIAAQRQGATLEGTVLEQLCRLGHMLNHKAQGTFSILDKPVPPLAQRLMGPNPSPLPKGGVSRIVGTWRRGHDLETLIKTDKGKGEVTEEQRLNKLRKRLMRQRVPPVGQSGTLPNWAQIVADIMLAQDLLRQKGVSGQVADRIIGHHLPHLRNPNTKRAALADAGCLKRIKKQVGRGYLWGVPDNVRTILREEDITPSMDQRSIQQHIDGPPRLAL